MPSLGALDASPLAVPQKFKTHPKLDTKIAACIDRVQSLGPKAAQETSKGLSHREMDHHPSSLARPADNGLSEDCVPPPSMVQDPNAPSISHPSPYVPVQPFVLPSNASLPPGQDLETPYLEPQTADNVLKHRLQSADKERSAPFVKRLATGPEVGKSIDGNKQGTARMSNPNSVNNAQTLSNNSVVQDAPFQSPTKDDDEEEDGEYIPPIEEEEDDVEEHQEDGGAKEGLQENTLDEEVNQMGVGTDLFNDADLGM